MIQISYRTLKKYVFLYLLLPCVVFALFLKNFFAICLFTGCALFYFFGIGLLGKKDIIIEKEESQSCFLSKKMVVLIFLILLVWTFLAGHGRWWFQTTDWDARNAIFRDLITHRWPVVYEWKNTALSYYIGHWLVPAAIGRVIYLVFGYKVAWVVGNLALWCWSLIGLFFIILLLLVLLKASSKRQILTVILVFVFFSGMDILGAIYMKNINYLFKAEVLHLEWWSPYQFSSITTCLCWVFNQSIIPWLVTTCLLLEKNTENYVFFITITLLCGVFPAVGLAMIMFTLFIVALIRCILNKEKLISFFKEYVFSPQNMIVLFSVFPFVFAYICSNAILAGTSGSNQVVAQGVGVPIKNIIVFLLVDAGIYIILLFKENKKNVVFYMIMLILLVCPFIKVGSGNDFTMRASIPALFILMTLCMQMLLNKKKERGYKIRKTILVVCLIIGGCTPAVELYRGVYHVVHEKNIFLASDFTRSFENTEPSINFEAFDYQNTFFYKYLADK